MSFQPETKPRAWVGVRGTASERFMRKVEKSAGCWEWTGGKHSAGYGLFWPGGPATSARMVYAHRFAYEQFVGPIPAGLQIDHLCRNRGCVNPVHLEPVTQRINIMRGTSPVVAQAAQTHCKRGHEFTPDNTYRNGGKRTCRTCQRAKAAA